MSASQPEALQLSEDEKAELRDIADRIGESHEIRQPFGLTIYPYRDDVDVATLRTRIESEREWNVGLARESRTLKVILEEVAELEAIVERRRKIDEENDAILADIQKMVGFDPGPTEKSWTPS